MLDILVYLLSGGTDLGTAPHSATIEPDSFVDVTTGVVSWTVESQSAGSSAILSNDSYVAGKKTYVELVRSGSFIKYYIWEQISPSKVSNFGDPQSNITSGYPNKFSGQNKNILLFSATNHSIFSCTLRSDGNNTDSAIGHFVELDKAGHTGAPLVINSQYHAASSEPGFMFNYYANATYSEWSCATSPINPLGKLYTRSEYGSTGLGRNFAEDSGEMDENGNTISPDQIIFDFGSVDYFGDAYSGDISKVSGVKLLWDNQANLLSSSKGFNSIIGEDLIEYVVVPTGGSNVMALLPVRQVTQGEIDAASTETRSLMWTAYGSSNIGNLVDRYNEVNLGSGISTYVIIAGGFRPYEMRRYRGKSFALPGIVTKDLDWEVEVAVVSTSGSLLEGTADTDGLHVFTGNKGVKSLGKRNAFFGIQRSGRKVDGGYAYQNQNYPNNEADALGALYRKDDHPEILQDQLTWLRWTRQSNTISFFIDDALQDSRAATDEDSLDKFMAFNWDHASDSYTYTEYNSIIKLMRLTMNPASGLDYFLMGWSGGSPELMFDGNDATYSQFSSGWFEIYVSEACDVRFYGERFGTNTIIVEDQDGNTVGTLSADFRLWGNTISLPAKGIYKFNPQSNCGVGTLEIT